MDALADKGDVAVGSRIRSTLQWALPLVLAGAACHQDRLFAPIGNGYVVQLASANVSPATLHCGGNPTLQVYP